MISNRLTYPQIIVATGYPVHADAFRHYLKGFYEITVVQHHAWQDGLAALEKGVHELHPPAIILDDAFAYGACEVAQWLRQFGVRAGLIYVDSNPNIFKVQHCLKEGYLGYLYLGDHLSDSLRIVVDAARRGERFLSGTIFRLYERYTAYQGLFSSLPQALEEILRLMGEGLNVQEICTRTGLNTTIVYRRQYRLRQHFGVETNEHLMEVISVIFDPDLAVRTQV